MAHFSRTMVSFLTAPPRSVFLVLFSGAVTILFCACMDDKTSIEHTKSLDLVKKDESKTNLRLEDNTFETILNSVPEDQRADIEESLKKQWSELAPAFREKSKLTSTLFSPTKLKSAFITTIEGWTKVNEGANEINKSPVHIVRAFREVSKGEAKAHVEIVDAKESPLFLLSYQTVLSGSKEIKWSNDVVQLREYNSEAGLGTLVAIVGNRFLVMVNVMKVKEEELFSSLDKVVDIRVLLGQ